MINDCVACDASITFEGHEAFLAGFVSAKVGMQHDRMRLCSRCRYALGYICAGAESAMSKRDGLSPSEGQSS
jgi:hypothetical protein